MRRLMVIAAALALSACGTASSSNDVKLSGAQQDVADVVDKLAAAGARHNAKTICNDILSKQLVTQLKSAGGDCETEIGDAIADATDYDLQVRSVKITGNNATAQVRQGKDGKVSTFTFVKEGGDWRATALGG